MKKKDIIALAKEAALKQKEAELGNKRSKALPDNNAPVIDGEHEKVKSDRARLKRIASWIIAKNLGDFESIRRLDEEATKANHGKVMVTTTNTAGGYTVADEFNATMIEKLQEQPMIADQCNREVMASLKQEISAENAAPSLSLVAENADIGTSDGSFEQVVLDAYKFAVRVPLSNELMDFNAVRPEVGEKIMNQLAHAVRQGIDDNIVGGTGSSQPTGLISETKDSSGFGTQVAGTDTLDTITYDELRRTAFKIKTRYRNRASWVMSENSLLLLSLLKDTNGRPLLFESTEAMARYPLAAGMLFNRPVYINDNISKTETVTGITAGDATAIFFGDLNYMFYGIPQIPGGQTYRLDITREGDDAWKKDQTQFRLVTFLASNIALKEAFAQYVYRGSS